MRFIDWIPIAVKHRPYDTMVFETGPRACDRCKNLNQPWTLTQYPDISNRTVREVCDLCLEIDKSTGLFDAIMDIWDNGEEYQGLGHKLTVKEFLNK